MITSISIKKQTLHFRAPFRIAYEEVTEAEIIIIQILDSQGNMGLGSASPDTEVTGETLEQVFQILNEKLTKDFFEYDLNNWYPYHEKIQKTFFGVPSAQHAVEEAFLNLWSKRLSIPLSSFFGGYRKTGNTMITIGIQSLEETLAEVEKRIQEGFKTIKIKCGLDVTEDLEKIKQVRKLISADGELVLDANQGYSFSDAEKMLEGLKNLPISFFEQPIEATNWEGMKALHKKSNIPIIADESVVSFEDAFELLSKDYVAGVNIKLMKCGGPINFLKIFYLAKSLQKKVMIGCMYESNISLTTGAALALGLPLDYIDLDSGHLDFYDDPVIGGMEVEEGTISIQTPLDIK